MKGSLVWFRVVALALMAFLVAPMNVAAQLSDMVIRFGTGPDDQSTPFLYAVKYGLYKKVGLDVQIVKLSGSSLVASALVGGSLDMGKGASLGVVTAIAKGLPLTIVGNVSYYNSSQPDTALVVSNASNIRKPKDLEGKTLAAVSLSDMNSVGTFAWLDSHGVDRSTLKYVEVPATASLAAMDQGRIVGSTLYEPFLSAALNTGRVHVLAYPFDAISKHFSSGLIFTSTAWAAANPDALTRFLHASDEAAKYVSAHPEVSTQLISDFGGTNPDIPIRHSQLGIPINPAVLQPIIDTAAKYGVIPKPFPAASIICSCALGH